MTKEDMKNNWYYFCSLAEQLQRTTQYVDHSVNDESEIINGNVFSYEFVKILMLASSEFEVIGKLLCLSSGKEKVDGILDISNSILSLFPNIGETEVITPYMRFKPLKDWKATGSGVSGIPWWTDHNKVKHSRSDSFARGTLFNSIYSMGSLMVLELYLDRIVGDSIDGIRCDYFINNYSSKYLVTEGREPLPDNTIIRLLRTQSKQNLT